MGNVWWSNTIKHCLVTKQVDFLLSGQTVSYKFERTKCFTVFEQIFDVGQILSNT